jgi:hypothetical protein
VWGSAVVWGSTDVVWDDPYLWSQAVVWGSGLLSTDDGGALGPNSVVWGSLTP